MFSRPMMLAIALGLAVGAPDLASADEGWPDDPQSTGAASDYDYARVTHVEPKIRQVRISVPQRECFEEAGYAGNYPPGDSPGYGQGGGERPAAGGMILGGLIGAVIGHQFGHGHERGIGTVAGAVIGSAIGHEAAMQRRGEGDYGYAPRAQSGERCETRYTERIEQRIDGYRVSYRYNDRDYQTVLPYDPGERLRVRVTVSPEGY
ncbi:MAG TPA: glycine zipper 2TM domain-containing protein [Steroidobacteraceae bacterium]